MESEDSQQPITPRTTREVAEELSRLFDTLPIWKRGTIEFDGALRAELSDYQDAAQVESDRVDELTRERDAARRESDERREALREAADAFIAKDEECLRLVLCDMNARSHASGVYVTQRARAEAAEAERDALKKAKKRGARYGSPHMGGEVQALHERLDECEAENEKLRAVVSELGHPCNWDAVMESLRRRNEALDENDRLKEEVWKLRGGEGEFPDICSPCAHKVCDDPSHPGYAR